MSPISVTSPHVEPARRLALRDMVQVRGDRVASALFEPAGGLALRDVVQARWERPLTGNGHRKPAAVAAFGISLSGSRSFQKTWIDASAVIVIAVRVTRRPAEGIRAARTDNAATPTPNTTRSQDPVGAIAENVRIRVPSTIPPAAMATLAALPSGRVAQALITGAEAVITVLSVWVLDSLRVARPISRRSDGTGPATGSPLPRHPKTGDQLTSDASRGISRGVCRSRSVIPAARSRDPPRGTSRTRIVCRASSVRRRVPLPA